MNQYIDFLEEVINIFEEENRSKRKYVGKVNFMSIILDN